MHDAAEAYIGDITRPLKTMIPDIRIIEDRVMRVIAAKFEMPWPEPPELQQYDDQVQKLEATMLLRRHDGVFHDRAGELCEIAGIAPGMLPEKLLEPMHPDWAEIAFMSRFRKVMLDDDGL